MACGRGFTRKYSAQRHVKDVESGRSNICRKDQYEMGVRSGTIVPRSYRPTYRKNDVSLADLFKQKLKEKLADTLADDVLRNPQDRQRVSSMFMAESIQKTTRSNSSDEFSEFVSRRMGQSRTP
jgi:hypothetical protein